MTKQSTTVEQQSCPSCGYCPHCGRSNQPQPYYVPWYPQPYPWYGPYLVTSGEGTSGTITVGDTSGYDTADYTSITYTS